MAINPFTPYARQPYYRQRSRVVRQAVAGNATVDELLGQIVSIRHTIASGVSSAAYGDKRTEFRSIEELREVLNALEEDLAALLGLGGRIRQIRMTNQWDKGL